MKRKTSTNGSVVPGVLIGSGVGILVSCTVAVFCPILILNEYIPHKFVPIMSLAIQFIGAFTGTLVGSHINKESKILSVILCAATMFVALLSCGMLLYTGNFSNIFSGLICYIVAGICSILIINTQNNGRKKNRTKRRSR